MIIWSSQYSVSLNFIPTTLTWSQYIEHAWYYLAQWTRPRMHIRCMATRLTVRVLYENGHYINELHSHAYGNFRQSPVSQTHTYTQKLGGKNNERTYYTYLPLPRSWLLCGIVQCNQCICWIERGLWKFVVSYTTGSGRMWLKFIFYLYSAGFVGRKPWLNGTKL